jgi:hypothetical protein
MGIGLVGFAVIVLLQLAIALGLFCIALRVGAGFWPPLWRSALAGTAALVGSQLTLLVGGALFYVARAFGLAENQVLQGLAALLLVAIQAGAIVGAVRWIIPRPDGTALPLRRCVGVAMVFAALLLALAAAFYAAFLRH